MIQELILENVFASGANNREYDKLYQQLSQFAHKIVVDEEEAKDIASKSIITVWTRGRSIENLAHLHVFARTIAANYCIDFIRRRKLKRQSDIYFFRKGEDTENVIANTIEENQLFMLVYSKVDGLPNKMKQVIKLTYFEGYSRREVSEKLNLSENTIRNMKVQALKALKIAIAPIIDRYQE